MPISDALNPDNIYIIGCVLSLMYLIANSHLATGSIGWKIINFPLTALLWPFIAVSYVLMQLSEFRYRRWLKANHPEHYNYMMQELRTGRDGVKRR